MPDASKSPSSPSPARSERTLESMRDRMSAAAHQRVARPKALLWIYALVALGAIVIFVGQLAGWWPSSVENKIRESHKPAAGAKPAPSPAPSPSDPATSAPETSR